MTAHNILQEAQALLQGHFLFTSGRHGAEYMQCARVLQYPQYTEILAKIIAQGFGNEKVEMVIAPAIGGIVIGYELARQLNSVSVFAERENGIMTLRRGFHIPQGTKVVVAEDVITTGKSSLEVMNIVREMGAEVLGVGVIVDRTGGKIDLGTKVVSAYSAEMQSYTAEECPLCKEGLPIFKPGSRDIKDFAK